MLKERETHDLDSFKHKDFACFREKEPQSSGQRLDYVSLLEQDYLLVNDSVDGDLERSGLHGFRAGSAFFYFYLFIPTLPN